jgi:hypothetical protein
MVAAYGTSLLRFLMASLYGMSHMLACLYGTCWHVLIASSYGSSLLHILMAAPYGISLWHVLMAHVSMSLWRMLAFPNTFWHFLMANVGISLWHLLIVARYGTS